MDSDNLCYNCVITKRQNCLSPEEHDHHQKTLNVTKLGITW